MTGTRHDLACTLPWLRDGSAAFLAAVNGLDDDSLRAPSRLPSWTRAHVIAHVARNAEALGRLATWARTGVETPMYLDAAQRAREIRESACQPPGRLRADLIRSAAGLDTALGQLDEDHWRDTVRTAQGRWVPAAEIPWMRVREVWLHTVDLQAGSRVADFPPQLVDALATDMLATLATRNACPQTVLVPTDRHERWTLGPAGPEDREAVTVEAPAAELLNWLAGRAGDPHVAASWHGRTIPAPQLPPWL